MLPERLRIAHCLHASNCVPDSLSLPLPPCTLFLSLSIRVGGEGRPGCGLSEEECKLVQRFEPGSELDTNGFFLAAFEKLR